MPCSYGLAVLYGLLLGVLGSELVCYLTGVGYH